MKNIDLKNIKVGDTIEFGRYPQGVVTDESAERIKAICGNPKTKRGSLWHDYNYTVGSGMYADTEYSDKRYRVVFKKKHRGSKLSYEFCDYRDGEVYVFIYEPIVWRVLDIDNAGALLVSEKVLDGQEFFAGAGKSGNGGLTVYMNNYEHSYVRSWLNGVFYETAFAGGEKSIVETAVVRNAPDTTKNEKNIYACADTEDKVFLLSYREAKNLFADNKARWKKATEYAKSQCCFAYKTHDAKFNNAVWWLRSPDHNYENCARCVGDGGGLGDGGFSCANEPVDGIEAVVPAIYIKIR